MRFAYDAFDPAGKPVSNTIEAADANEASDALRRQGLFVTAVTPDTGQTARGGRPAQAGQGGAAQEPGRLLPATLPC
jgi:type II secretory pathway component PulF